uniref:Uncharacterized protein n=1 Tax=Anguilla anguilla TaxID=7936 RepID=A0A0E9T3Q8_ANGAN
MLCRIARLYQFHS